jgi:MazG family protein
MNQKPPTPNDPTSIADQLASFVELVWMLRKQCPWDKEQTHKSISHLLIEEAYETVDAIEAENAQELSKELGDILLHVVMHSVMAEQEGTFTLGNVVEQEFQKLVFRHPHIFGDHSADNSKDVLETWERRKLKEGRTSALQGVPRSLPAALRAQRVQEKAANVGFDWDNPADVWEKVYEELREFQHELAEGNKDKAEQEFGDLLFAMINAARHAGIVAEDALHGTIAKFTRRFQFIEQEVQGKGLSLSDMELKHMDELWNKAKGLED